MSTRCFIPVLGKRLRAISLDECGNVPASGTANSVITTGGFISIQLSSQVEDGVEIITRRADGSLCVNEMASPSFKRFTVEMEFCGVDPGLISVVTNAQIYEDYSNDPIGFTVPEGTIDSKFSLELWTGLSGAACEPGADTASGYLLSPFLNAGVMSDVSIDGENAVTFGMTGAFTKGGNAWGVGSMNVMRDDTDAPAPLPTALDPFDHLLMIETGLAYPAEVCGLTTFLPDAA